MPLIEYGKRIYDHGGEGIDSHGTVVWAYASGCAAAHRPQETASATESTVLQCDRKDIPQSWQAAIMQYADTC